MFSENLKFLVKVFYRNIAKNFALLDTWLDFSIDSRSFKEMVSTGKSRIRQSLLGQHYYCLNKEQPF